MKYKMYYQYKTLECGEWCFLKTDCKGSALKKTNNLMLVLIIENSDLYHMNGF